MIATIVAAGCGSAQPTATPTASSTETPEPTTTTTPAQASTLASDLSDAEAEYLEDISPIDRTFGDLLASISEALRTTWPTRERLLDVLGEADVSATFAAARKQVEQLSPPDKFGPDHSRYLEFLNEATPYLHDHDQAVQGGDLVGVFVGRAHAFVARGKMRRGVSAGFCNALTHGAPEGAPTRSPFCGGEGEQLPGGEYGTALHAIFRLYATEFNPRVSSFPPAFTPDELYSSLAILNPEIETVIEEARDMVMALTPSAELRADHDRLILYLEENLELARAISQAARDQDGVGLRTDLFPESGIVLCNAQRELSPTIRPLVTPFFGDEVPEQCR